jgi:hypothetical protein
VVVAAHVVTGHPRTDNRSTRDGTEVLGRRFKCLVCLGLRNPAPRLDCYRPKISGQSEFTLSMAVPETEPEVAVIAVEPV